MKQVFEDLHPLVFNTVRLVRASLIFLGLARLTPGPSVLPVDRVRLVVLALFGHTFCQFFFVYGLDETTASNSAILLGLTPVFVAVLSALMAMAAVTIAHFWLGEPVGVLQLAGAAIIFTGIYLVRRRRRSLDPEERSQ